MSLVTQQILEILLNGDIDNFVVFTMVMTSTQDCRHCITQFLPRISYPGFLPAINLTGYTLLDNILFQAYLHFKVSLRICKFL